MDDERPQWRFAFTLDCPGGREHWISPGQDGRAAKAEIRPYGAMLTQFINMDAALLEEVAQVLSDLGRIESTESYEARWPELRQVPDRLEALAGRLPRVFDDFTAILRFYLNEYITDPAAGAGPSRAEIGRLAWGGQLLEEHCGHILEGRQWLREQAARGRFARRPEAGAPLPQPARDWLEGALSGRYVLLGSPGRPRLALCWEAGVDLAGFLAAALADLLNGDAHVIRCPACGRVRVFAGQGDGGCCCSSAENQVKL